MRFLKWIFHQWNRFRFRNYTWTTPIGGPYIRFNKIPPMGAKINIVYETDYIGKDLSKQPATEVFIDGIEIPKEEFNVR